MLYTSFRVYIELLVWKAKAEHKQKGGQNTHMCAAESGRQALAHFHSPAKQQGENGGQVLLVRGQG